MESSSGDKWFIDELGSYASNPAGETVELRVMKYGSTLGVWKSIQEIDTSNFNVQQRFAVFHYGGLLLAYGIDVDATNPPNGNLDNKLLECHYVISTGSSACGHVNVGGSVIELRKRTNYIGAAVAPDGDRLVYWTEERLQNPPGKFEYTYQISGAWQSVVSTTLTAGSNFANLSYVRVDFVDNNKVRFMGEIQEDSSPTDLFTVGLGEFTLGHQINVQTRVTWLGQISSESIWHETTANVTHVFIRPVGASNGTRYYYYNPNGTWGDSTISFANKNFGRICYDDDDNTVYLALGSSASIQAGLKIRKLDLDVRSCTTTLPWASATTLVAPALPHAGFLSPSGIYTSRNTYNRGDVDVCRFALVGQQGVGGAEEEGDDNEIWEVVMD